MLLYAKAFWKSRMRSEESDNWQRGYYCLAVGEGTALRGCITVKNVAIRRTGLQIPDPQSGVPGSGRLPAVGYHRHAIIMVAFSRVRNSRPNFPGPTPSASLHTRTASRRTGLAIGSVWIVKHSAADLVVRRPPDSH